MKMNLWKNPRNGQKRVYLNVLSGVKVFAALDDRNNVDYQVRFNNPCDQRDLADTVWSEIDSISKEQELEISNLLKGA